ncbi:MMPL family transporter [Streptomyces goshikiensis]|uniref:MMPL family transporter n=1 Tax=Streptomyces goshikiensis TaxID=1942 RepID=UPI0036DD7634
MLRPVRTLLTLCQQTVLSPLLVVAGWLLAACVTAPFIWNLTSVTGMEQSALLPRSAESTEVARILELASPQGESLPVVVVWTTVRTHPGDPGGSRLRSGAAASLSPLEGHEHLVGAPARVVVSQDATSAAAVLQVRQDTGEALGPTLKDVRRAAARAAGTRVALAGPAAVQADLDGVFQHVDGRLLLAALIAVLLILLLVYRSPVLPLLVISASVLALCLACACLYALARSRILPIDGQVQGILFVLVIGAATDYGLLLTSRYREELDRGLPVREAVREARRRSLGPIAASAATVALGLLTLLLSDLPANRSLGPAGALAMVAALLCSLTFLPAALVLLGPAAFWPRHRRPAEGRGPVLWHRISGAVALRPRRIWSLVLATLIAGVTLSPLLGMGGVPLNRALPPGAASVVGQAALERRFPAGLGNPAVVLTDPDRVEEVRSAAARTPGAASAEVITRPDGRPVTVSGLSMVSVTLTDVADSKAAGRTVAGLRTALGAIPGARARVGGQAAQTYDGQVSASHDRLVIMPTVLGVVMLILALLLRCLLLPALLVVSVALTFLAALGVCAVLFLFVHGSAETEPTIVLYSFVFLVALGVDYNIFLMHRVREEALRHGTRTGVRRGVTSTGGVISSAGVVLAATFAALTVMPLVFLVHIGAIVAVGVLMDTLLVRLFLVPALVSDLGPRAWWPGAVPADAARTLVGPRAAPSAVPRERAVGP